MKSSNTTKIILASIVSLLMVAFVFANNFGADPAGPGGGGGVVGNWNTGGSFSHTGTVGGMDYNYSECGGCGMGVDDGGGDYYGGVGGKGIYSCFPRYIECYSDENICGWKNKGTKDISCGGSCSAQTPEDPKFNINGTEKSVGDSCTVLDSCGKTHTGVVTCDGVCAVEKISATCARPRQEDNNTPANNTNDPFSSLETLIYSFADQGTGSNSGSGGSTWPPDDKEHSVAVYAIPPLVKDGTKAQLFVSLVGLDYCVLEGSNGDKWSAIGLADSKLDYIKNKKQINDWNRFSSTCKDDEKRATAKFGGRFAQSASSEDSDSEELAEGELSEFKCPDPFPKKDSGVYDTANISFVKSSPLHTETKFTIKKCYVMDHNGKVAEYKPSVEDGDVVSAIVKVIPKFIEY